MTTADWVQTAIYAAMLGVAFGALKAGQSQHGKDIGSIKRALGLENGKPGVFVRTQEYEYSRDSHEADIARLEKELAELRNRLA